MIVGIFVAGLDDLRARLEAIIVNDFAALRICDFFASFVATAAFELLCA
ncbi:hypothetical protein [Mesorhizobium sp.]|nr:hypothetical protein [Mesorhizobium sp.]